MNLYATGREVAHKGGGSVAADYICMASHSSEMSTKRAYDKHEMSLDRDSVTQQCAEMHIGERIAAARTTKRWSQARLAEAINQAQTTISSWERGRTEPGRDDVERVAAALGLSPSDLEPASSSESTVPVVGYVQAGAEAVLFSAGQGPFDYVPAPPGSTAQTVAVEIRGESLGPIFSEWLVFYDDVRSPVTPDLYGKLCVVGLPDGRILVKQVKPSKTSGLYHLMSQTEGSLLDQEILWAAKVKNMSPR